MKAKTQPDWIEHMNQVFQQYHKAQDAKEIAQCANANKYAGICPAARDTFIKLLEGFLEYCKEPKD